MRAGVFALALIGCSQLLGLEAPAPIADAGAGFLECAPGRASCGGNLCDTDTKTSAEHCGGCDRACAAVNGGAQCVDGACVLSCSPGWADCDGRSDNGCEASLSAHDTCGRCDRACQAGACLSGACSPYAIYPASTYLLGMAADDSHVFFTEATGALRKVPRDGSGVAQTLVSTDVAACSHLAFVDPKLAVSARRANVNTLEVSSVTVNGKTFSCLVSALSQPRDLSADPRGVVWTDDRSGDGGIVKTTALDAGCPGSPTEYVYGPWRRADRLFLQGDDVYFTAFEDFSVASGSIARLKRSTGAVETLVQKTRPGALAVDATHVYFVYLDSTVVRFPKSGCQNNPACIETIYFEEYGRILRLFVDEQQIVLLAVGSGNTLVILDKKDGKPLQRVVVENAPTGHLVVLPKTIYFSANNIYGLAR